MKKAIFLFFSSILVFSCSDIDRCESDSNLSFMIVRFYDIETTSSKKVGFRISADDDPRLFELEDDSLEVGLFLNPIDTTTTFYFDTDTMDYSLQVRYNQEFSIFDPACDPSLTFIGLDTLSSSFDSTVVVGRVTNAQLPTNIEVYF